MSPPSDPDLGPPARGVLAELTRAECLDLLAATRFGRVVVSTAAAQTPMIRPVNYAFDVPSQSVVFRTLEGSKFHAIVHSARACFEIDALDAETGSGWSVIVAGVAEEVTAAAETRRLEQHGLTWWTSHAEPHWVRIRAGTVSGRRLAVDP